MTKRGKTHSVGALLSFIQIWNVKENLRSNRRDLIVAADTITGALLPWYCLYRFTVFSDVCL